MSGLLNFGKQQVVSNATTAVAYNIDKTFQPRARVSMQVSFQGAPGTRFAAHGTPYKPRDHDDGATWCASESWCWAGNPRARLPPSW